MDRGIVLRNICLEDIPKILAVQRESYPEVASGQLYMPLFLENHISLFYEGQFCVESDGEVVASATSLRVLLEPEYKDHTWQDIITQFGNPHLGVSNQCDSLYVDDMVTRPDFRHLGIGTLMFKARKEVAKKCNLRRIIGGGRIPYYSKHAHELSAWEYVERVGDGRVYDPVLTFQIKNGFKVIKILTNYLFDPSSLNYATFIEWSNPNYQSSTESSDGPHTNHRTYIHI